MIEVSRTIRESHAAGRAGRRRYPRPLACLALVLAVAAIGCNEAAEQAASAASQPHEIPPELLSLFDGTALESIEVASELPGWRRLGGEAEFRFEEDVLVGISKAGTPNTFLASEEIFDDFVLEYEFLVDPELNSGVQVRSATRPDYADGRVHGYQIEIDPSPRAWTAGIYDESRRGWLFPMASNPEAQRAFRPNDWNRVLVACIGTTLRTWLNQVPAAYLVDDLPTRGFIAFQVHSVANELADREVRWRNVRILRGDAGHLEKVLESAATAFPLVVNHNHNVLDPRERELGWRLLWDGQTTRGWRGAHAETFPETGWQIEDGRLTVVESGGGEAAHGGDIVTEEEFGAFELQLEFLLSEGANSGIKYFVTEDYGSTGSAIGVEYQLLDDERHPDAQLGRDGNRTLASLYDLIAAQKQPRFVKPVGEWNHARLVVRPDRHVEHWLNHIEVLEYELGSPEFLELVAISKYKDWEGFGLWQRGHVLLQDHGNQVSFRSIRLREL